MKNFTPAELKLIRKALLNQKLSKKEEETSFSIYEKLEELEKKPKVSGPLKSKFVLSDMLMIIHMSIVKHEGKNSIVLKEVQDMDEKLTQGKFKDMNINYPMYWTGVFSDLKENGFIIIE